MADEEKKEKGNPTPPVVKEGDSPKTYTEEEVIAKLRGSGTKISELENKISEFQKAEAERQQKLLEEQGEFKKLHEAERERAAKLESELSTLRERELKRIESLSESNKKRISSLPKKLRELVPEQLEPDEQAKYISRIEKLSIGDSESEGAVRVDGGSGRSGPPKTLEEHHKQLKEKARTFVFGKKKESK